MLLLLMLILLITNILNLKCGQDLEPDTLSRFQNWRLVQSFRLKIVNILKLNNIRNIKLKLEFD